MSNFKVGDRVAVFDASAVGLHRTTGKISKISKFGLIEFVPDLDPIDGRWYVHPKQCRRLVKKERRRMGKRK